MARTPLPRTPRKLDAIPGREPRDEQTMAMIVALLSEVTILRARLDTAERLLVGAGVLAPGAIDGFDPDPAAQAEREALRQHAIAKVLRPMHELAREELARVAQTEKA
jgi:hypothetical protein